MQEQKKEKLKILVIDWLIILGVYLFGKRAIARTFFY